MGTWTIVSNDNVAPDGTKRQIFGPNPKGIFILGADGRYVLLVVNPARPKFGGKSRLDGTPEENKAAIAGTVAAFGTWLVDEATNTLVTSIEGNLFPNDEGRDQRASSHWQATNSKWSIHRRAPVGKQKSFSNERSDRAGVADVRVGSLSVQRARKALFDHLVGAGEKRWWHYDPEGFRRLCIDYQFEFRWLHDWQIGGLFALQNSSRVSAK